MQTDDSMYSHHAEQDEHPTFTESTPLISEPPISLQTCGATVAQVQFLTLCLSTFILGWNSSRYFLLFFNLEHYGIGMTEGIRVVQLSQGIGIAAGGLINMPLTPTLGFGKIVLLGSAVQTIACLLQAILPIWPLFVSSYFLQGLGLVLLNTHARAFIAVKRHNDFKMGLLFVIHDVGNMASLSFLSQNHHSEILRKCYLFFSLFLSFLSVVTLVVVFRLRKLDVCLREGGDEPCDSEPDDLSHLDGFTQLIGMKTTHILAAFYSVYTVTRAITTLTILRYESGHLVAFLSVLSSGSTLGYVILIPLNRKVGEINAAYYYTLSAIVALLVAYFVPLVAVQAIAVGWIGIIYSVLSPIVMTYTGRTIPRHLVPGAIGWLTTCSTIFLEAVPPVSNAIFSRYGVSSLLLCAFIGLILMSLALYRLRKTPSP
ncbi:major facilitator superfamily domain-containing protein [Crepidotus variabilis]|uniref:Major facilitator superfamily domain-containing protein n=1 Tax=Crepidotus variabilis TaxID=179855 RepID=A0A9P6EAU5_9AGAR|nr:major facilitator superfamily domain-containing protein [Crepidotus variabilis]